MAFTPAQQEAIERDGHLLIVAGPGSGKTTTSVAKAQRILQDPTRSLIMVTFTKEGAEEMRRRLEKAQTESGQKPFPKSRLRIGTFHSIALSHVFEHRPRVQTLSPAQQGIMLTDAMSPYSGDIELVKQIRQEFEAYMYAVNQDDVELSSAAAVVINRYKQRLQASRSTDLYSVMRDCAILCDQGTLPPMPFTDMLVDEGQDTDELQKVWIFAHARAGVNVTIVGDDDQSIYEWRHALGYAGMKDFMDTFQAHRVELGDNFRCREEILTHAVHLIQHNRKRLPKHLVARRGAGGKIVAYHTVSPDAQCEELAELISRSPQAHTNVAILARQNRSLNDLEMYLTGLGLSYVRVGRSIWDDMWVASYLTLLQSLLDGSPVGIFGCLGALGLDDAVKTELLQVMRGNADSFMRGDVPDLESATATDKRLLKDFSGACKYWRVQLSAGGVAEVILDVAEWLASKQRSPRARDVVLRSSRILSKLTGNLGSRLFFISQNKKGTASAPIILMTMHGSKGLEFEAVHVIDACHQDDGSTLVNEEAERRLMYVAMTRAKNRCFVWYSGQPHSTIAESQIPVLHEFDHLLEVALA